MKAIITETMRYEVEVKDKFALNRLQASEDSGNGGIAELITEGTAKLRTIHRTIEEKW